MQRDYFERGCLGEKSSTFFPMADTLILKSPKASVWILSGRDIVTASEGLIKRHQFKPWFSYLYRLPYDKSPGTRSIWKSAVRRHGRLNTMAWDPAPEQSNSQSFSIKAYEVGNLNKCISYLYLYAKIHESEKLPLQNIGSHLYQLLFPANYGNTSWTWNTRLEACVPGQSMQNFPFKTSSRQIFQLLHPVIIAEVSMLILTWNFQEV